MERELDSLHYRFQSAVDKDELAALVYPGVCDSQTRTVSVEFARFLQILNMR